MLLFTVIGSLLSVVGFSTLVAGDSGPVITISKVQVTNNGNDFFDPVTVEIGEGKKNSILTIGVPTKKDLPDSMLFKLNANLGGDPIETESTLCEAMDDETIGKSMVKAGVPKDSFPQACPFKAGDWTVMKWEPPSDSLPPGIPDGPITGYVQLFEDGKEPYAKIDFEGEISTPPPSVGRR